MVDIVFVSHMVFQMHTIIDRSKNILFGDMLRDQVGHASFNCLKTVRLLFVLLQDLLQNRVVYFLGDSQFFLVRLRQKGMEIYHHIGKNLYAVSFLVLYVNKRNRCVLDLIRQLLRDESAGLSDHFSGLVADRILSKSCPGDAVAERKFFVEFISSDLGQVITSHVKKHGIEKAESVLIRQRLARTDSLIQLKNTLFRRLRGVLLQTGQDFRLVTKHLQDLFVGSHTERTDQHRDGHFTVTIHFNIEHIRRIRLILQPCSTIRDHLSRIQLLSDLIVGNTIINPRGSYQLRYDDTLCTVDHKRTGAGHQRKISHKNLLLADLLEFVVMKSYLHLECSRVSSISLLTLLNRVFYFIPTELEIDELQTQRAVEIGNWRDVTKYLTQALFEEPVIGILLNLDQVRHFQNFPLLRVTHPDTFAHLDRANSVFFHEDTLLDIIANPRKMG